MRSRPLIVAALVLAGTATPARAATPLQPVQPGFQDQVVLEDLESPMAVRFAPPPDRRIFVAGKSGVVHAFDGPGDRAPAPVVDLSTDVHDFWDRGLLGMALDPAFATNPYLYLLYTRDARIGGRSPTWSDTCPRPADAGCETSARLVRVRIDELGVAGAVQPLIEDEWCQQFPSHSIGTVAFGPDGMLYAGAGDAANFDEPDHGQLPDSGDAPPNPCGDPPREGGMLRSQDVRTTGGPDRPRRHDHPREPGHRRPGARQPVHGARREREADRRLRPAQPVPVHVPPRHQRAVARGRRLVRLGGGRPNPRRHRRGRRELRLAVLRGRRPAGSDATPLALPLCTSLPASATTKPVLAYDHEAASFHGCDLRSGASLAGIAFAPDGYPDAYDGALFAGDFAAACVFALRAGRDGEPDPGAVELFARRPSGAGGPVELQAGPGGDLYYTLFDPVDPSRGSLRRIAYRPGNRAPVANAVATPDAGPAPLGVAFSAAGSTDPDDDALTYAWDLDGDERFDDATGVTASRTYEAGQVRVSVRVTDAEGASDTATVTVSAGNTRPRPVIDAPARGRQWTAGDEIAFHGSATDDEDGAVGAAGLDWVITLDHCIESGGCHAHPLEQRHGAAGGTFTAPVHPFPARLVISLVATDSGNLQAETSIRIDQRPPAGPAASPTAAPSPGPATRPAPVGERLGVRLSARDERALARRIPLAARCSHTCVLHVRADLLTRGRTKRLPSPALAGAARADAGGRPAPGSGAIAGPGGAAAQARGAPAGGRHGARRHRRHGVGEAHHPPRTGPLAVSLPRRHGGLVGQVRDRPVGVRGRRRGAGDRRHVARVQGPPARVLRG